MLLHFYKTKKSPEVQPSGANAKEVAFMKIVGIIILSGVAFFCFYQYYYCVVNRRANKKCLQYARRASSENVRRIWLWMVELGKDFAKGELIYLLGGCIALLADVILITLTI